MAPDDSDAVVDGLVRRAMERDCAVETSGSEGAYHARVAAHCQRLLLFVVRTAMAEGYGQADLQRWWETARSGR
jgi:hypothetical protein